MAACRAHALAEASQGFGGGQGCVSPGPGFRTDAGWSFGAGCGRAVVDLDGVLVLAHFEEPDAAAIWKKTFGRHPLMGWSVTVGVGVVSWSRVCWFG